MFTRRFLNNKETLEIRCTITKQINNNRQDEKVYLITLCIALEKEIDTIFCKIQSRFHFGRRVPYEVWRGRPNESFEIIWEDNLEGFQHKTFRFYKRRVRNISGKQNIHMECKMEETSEQETQFQWRDYRVQ